MGSRLLTVERPRDAAWERYRRGMEDAMTELDNRMRRFERTRWIACGGYAVYLLAGLLVFLQRRPSLGDLELGVLAVWAIIMFVLGILIVGVFHLDRANLEIRRDIKELTVAVVELRESLSTRTA
jgi:hypothetical protein